ncbi:MAG: hypothetical protein AB2A00_01825, partial [Myxococcota bacterium]
MTAQRSPILGYNHQVVHLGWHFHVQTEDSGPQKAHIFTHLFHNGSILASKKLVYDPASAPEFVKDLMQAQHKAVMRELKRGAHDEHIKKLLGEPPDASGGFEISTTESNPAIPIPSEPPHTPSPLPDSGTSLEWKPVLSTPPLPFSSVSLPPIPPPMSSR